MMNTTKRKLTLYPATYQIKVPGHIDTCASEWAEPLTIAYEEEGAGPPVTTLTGTIDQAALQGVLRRLYALGLPLISVTWINGE